MKNILSLVIAFVLLASVILVSGDTKNVSAQTSDLVSQLPTSDAVATVNLKRLINDVAPQVLASNPAKLAELNAFINEIKGKTGVDLRQFEQAAIAMNFKPGRVDAEALSILRGNFNATGLLAAGKVAANGKFRQEQIAGKSITIFAFSESAKKPLKQGESANDTAKKTMSDEIAAYVVDANTIAVGKLSDVRSILNKSVAKSRADNNLIELVNRNPNAVMSFAGNIPAETSATASVGNDQVDKILKSLRQMFGTIDMNSGTVLLNLVAKTSEEPQAQELEQTLLGLQMLGKAMLGGKPDEKNQIISRALENLKITRSLSEVQLQTNLPQADVETVVKGIK